MWFWDVSGVGPQLAFGGGYELAIKQNNRMTKIEDIIYVNHVYNPTEGIALIPIVKKVDYWNDILVIRILDLTAPPNAPGVDCEYRRSAIYLIPPVDYDWSTAPPPSREQLLSEIPDMNATHFATHIRVNSTKAGIEPHSIVMQGSHTIDKPVEFKYTGDGELPTEFLAKSNYCQQIVEQVRKVVIEAGESYG